MLFVPLKIKQIFHLLFYLYLNKNALLQFRTQDLFTGGGGLKPKIPLLIRPCKAQNSPLDTALHYYTTIDLCL
jgi:hypothetical protein